MLVTKQPVRGGLKGGPAEGQAGPVRGVRRLPRLRPRRRPALAGLERLARLEKLFVKLYVEEEDVTVPFLLDASASMDGGRRRSCVFAKRAAAAMAYIGARRRTTG